MYVFDRLKKPPFLMALCLFVVVFTIGLLTYDMKVDLTPDGTQMFQVTKGLVHHGKLLAEQDDGTLMPVRYGVTQSIFMVPFYATGAAFSHIQGVPYTPEKALQWSYLASPFSLALQAVLLFLAGLALGFRKRTSLAVALIFAFTTFAWGLVNWDFSEPIAGVLITGGFLALLRYSRRKSLPSLAAAGVLFGFAFLARATLIAVLLAPFIYLLVATRNRDEAGDGSPLSKRLAGIAREFGVVGIPIVAAVAFQLWFNFYRFGSVTKIGYGSDEVFVANPLKGIYGLLVSPGRGVLIYAPALIISAVFFRRFMRRNAPAGAFILTAAAAIFLVSAFWYGWYGGNTWGPRFLLPVLPLALLPAGEWFELERRSKVATATVCLLLAFGLLLEVCAVLVPPQAFDAHDRQVKTLTGFTQEGIQFLPLDSSPYYAVTYTLGRHPYGLNIHGAALGPGGAWSVIWPGLLLGSALLFLAWLLISTRRANAP